MFPALLQLQWLSMAGFNFSGTLPASWSNLTQVITYAQLLHPSPNSACMLLDLCTRE